MAKKPQKILASSAITDPSPRRDTEKIHEDNLKWIPFFRDNNIYPNDLSKRAQRSGTHGAICLDKLTYAIGDGLVFTDLKDERIDLNPKQQDWVDNINKYGQSLTDFTKHLLRGYIFSGNAYAQVEELPARTNLYCTDFTQPRYERAENPSKFYLSSFWREIGTSQSVDQKRNPVVEIDVFDWTSKRNKLGLVHIKNKVEESDYYGMPDHIGALPWADIEYKIPKFNIAEFDNGFFPSIYLGLMGEPPEGMSAQDYVKKVQEKFTGEGNNAKFLIEFLSNSEMKPFIHEFSKALEGKFESLQKLAVQMIVTSHRWDGKLLGVQEPGKLGISGKDVRNAFERIENTVIKEYRRPVLETINKILQRMPLFKGVKVGIASSYPVSFAGDIDVNKIIKGNEARKVVGYEPFDEGDPRGEMTISEIGTKTETEVRE